MNGNLSHGAPLRANNTGIVAIVANSAAPNITGNVSVKPAKRGVTRASEPSAHCATKTSAIAGPATSSAASMMPAGSITAYA